VNTQTMSLAKALGLKPLDRVLVASKHALREANAFHQLGYRKAVELPYWFYQGVREDGMLRLMAPNGYVDYVDPLEVQDLIPGEPIKVMAIPREFFLARLKLPLAERVAAPGDEWYREGSIMHAQRDRWGGFAYRIWFDDERFNGEHSDTFTPTLKDGEERRVKPLTRRHRMPVAWRGSGPSSAEHGVANAATKVERVVGSFIQAALIGDNRKVAALLDVSINHKA
jgi:hypothetical protein